MATSDWYRRTSWSDADRSDFERRLARARPDNRAQYLLIQAGHLSQTRDEQLIRVALALVDRMLKEFPDTYQTAPAHAQRAECLLRLGDWDGAVQAFRATLDAERRRPNVLTNAYLRFGYLVVTRDARDLFDEVAQVTQEHAADSRLFPVERFRWHAIQALLCTARGDEAQAREHARAALAAAEAQHSGLRYHADLGLVREVDAALEQRLRMLAGVSAP